MIPFFYGIPVWGDAYVEKLCRIAIPSLLAPGNIPAMPNNEVSSFVIVTTPADEMTIRSKAIFKLLESVINVEFLHLPTGDGGLPDGTDHRKYSMLSKGHGMVVDRAIGRGCVVFLGPDAIHTDGMTRHLYDQVMAGKQVVTGTGPRVAEETIVPELERMGLLKDGQPLVVRPRPGVKLLMQHLHSDDRAQRWTSAFFARNPHMCVWDLQDGMLVRSFAQHPYVMDYRELTGWRPRPHEASPVDGTFIKDCAISWDKIYQVTDSDEFFCLSLTPMHVRAHDDFPNNDPFETLIRWAARDGITTVHQWYFTTAVKFHTGDLDDRWNQAERETLVIAYYILDKARQLPKVNPDPRTAVDMVNRILSDPRGIPEGITEKLALRTVKLALRVACRKAKRTLGLQHR
jgi:hypothetical protein